MTSDLYLGLDGGGTKTEVCLLDSELREIGRGLGGPCNIATGDEMGFRESTMAAASSALAAAALPADRRFTSVCAAVAGFTARERRDRFGRLLRDWLPAERHRVEPDYVGAWWGATEGGPGIVVIAGTGAVVYGRNATGQDCRVDGRGWLLGDRGSGFSIGMRALTAVIRRLDQGKANVPFDAALMSELGLADADALVEWVYRDFQPARIASVAPIVGRLAADGDRQAVILLDSAGWMLRRSVQRVIRTLAVSPTELPVYIAGSLWCIGGPFLESFRCGPKQSSMVGNDPEEPEVNGYLVPCAELKPLEPAHDAAFGAALLAAQVRGAER